MGNVVELGWVDADPYSNFGAVGIFKVSERRNLRRKLSERKERPILVIYTKWDLERCGE